MPLPKNFTKPAPDPSKDRILLTVHGLGRLCGTHDQTILRALANNQIAAAAWADLNGTLAPLFSPSCALAFIGRRAGLIPHDSPPTILA